MKIINCTPHLVSLVTEEGTLEFPPSGIVPRLEEEQKKLYEVFVNGISVDVMKKAFLQPEGMPEPENGTTYIVSALIAGACPGRTDLIIPNDTIRDEKGRIVGCKNFARI